jgi:hypothetical protein
MHQHVPGLPGIPVSRSERHPRLWHGTAQISVVDGEVIEGQQRLAYIGYTYHERDTME